MSIHALNRLGGTVLLLLAAASAPLVAQSRALATANLDSIVTANIARDGTVGAAVAVVRGADTVLLAAYGKADVEADRALERNAILAIGSISKQFTAAALLQLRDRGVLALDDDITKWLPDFDTKGARITLRQLLTHTSGLSDVSRMPGLNQLRFVTANYDAAVTRDSMYAVIARVPLASTPGTTYAYSSAGYWLLHRVIERASGMPYAQYLSQHVFTPLGLRDTGNCHGAPGNPRRAAGYGVRGGQRRRAPESAPDFYLGSGGLCSTASDMVTWLQALHGGKVVSAASYAEMITPATLGNGEKVPYGLGLDIREDARGNSIIGHSGEIAGYAASANWYPESRMAVVVLMNSSFDSSPTALGAELAAAVLDAGPAGTPSAVSRTRPNARELEH